MTMPPMHSPLTLDPATDLSTQRVRRLSVSEAHQWLQSTQPVLVVDVRERWEFDLGHIAGAKWVPLSAFPKALEDMGLAVDQPILTYCHHGVRSVKAAQIMQQHGMANVASMDGGIDAWAQQVDTQLGRY